MKKNGNKKKNPRVSVIVPAYNHEKYIAESLQSVLSQSFQDFEIIVIDDGSTDRTPAEIKKFRDSRIRFFEQENRGAARTINKGIRLCCGEFVSILNSDDVYHPERLARMVSIMDSEPDCMIVSSHIQPIDPQGKPADSKPEYDLWCTWYENAVRDLQENQAPFFSLLRHNYIASTSNIFIRSEIFRNNEPFNTLLAYCHDYEFLLRIIGKYPFVMLEDKLLFYRIHERNTIRENEFLKHLEVLYAIFTTVDIRELLAETTHQQRMKVPIFRSLFGNPELNRERYALEYLDIIEEKNRTLENLNRFIKELHHEIEDRGERLAQADKWLKKARHDAERMNEKILKYRDDIALIKFEVEQRDEWSRQYKEKLEKARFALQAKEKTLQEIYHSKGWLWLMRYRKFKFWLDQFKIISWMKKIYFPKADKSHENDKEKHSIHKQRPAIVEAVLDFIMESPGKLGVYRKLKNKLRKDPCRLCDDLNNDEFTQHINIIHSVENNRPVVIHAIANFMTGGSSRLVADLIEHLGHRYQQEVITFYAPNPPVYTGFPIHEFPRSSEMVAAFLKQKKVNILHVHYWGECDDPWYRRVFTAAGKHRCIVVENVNTPVETYIDNVIDHYVYVSHHAKNYGSTVPEPVSVIYPGSNLELFRRNGTPIPDNVIGMVYRLEKDKLQEDAIQVFIDVIKRRPGTKALIVGGGTFLESYKKQVAKEKLSDSFEFTGYVAYDRLSDYYRRLAVFVAPVWKESFGQVSSFAMGMEIPVAGYHVGALPEIFNSDRFLGHSREELADIIIDLLDNREKRLEIGTENRKRAVNHFSLEAMIRQYDLLYQKLLNR